MKAKRYLLLGTAVAMCAASLGWYGSVTGTVNNESQSRTATLSFRPVPTAVVRDYSNTTTRLFPGTVQAAKSANIGFSVDGLLVELNGLEGEPVQEGDVLARIDQRDFQNNYDAARANYQRARADFKRTETLYRKQVISQSEYDTSKTAHDVALAEMNIRKKGLSDTVITAPYDAVISRRFVENNEHIKGQSAIFAIQDISTIEVVIQVPERLMAHGAVTGFKDIWVNFDADTRRWFPAKIKEYSVQSDPMTRTYDVAVSLERPSDLEIMPGMTATVRTVLETAEALDENGQLTIVPMESVFSMADGNSYIWIIPENGGNPKKKKILLGEMSGQDITVRSGLATGTRVATAGVQSLTEEMNVRPMKEGGEGLDG